MSEDKRSRLFNILKEVKLFIFDFDGTLIQSNKIKRAAFYYAVEGVPEAALTLDHIFKTKPELNRFDIFDLFSKYHTNISRDVLVKRYSEICESLIFQAPEVPGALSFLQCIKDSGRRSVVCSATPEQALLRTIKGLPLFPYVEVAVGQPKSKTENIYLQCQNLQVDVDKIVMIGDGKLDQLAAHEVKCPFVAVRSDQNDFYTEPDFWVSDLFELKEVMFPEGRNV